MAGTIYKSGMEYDVSDMVSMESGLDGRNNAPGQHVRVAV